MIQDLKKVTTTSFQAAFSGVFMTNICIKIHGAVKFWSILLYMNKQSGRHHISGVSATFLAL
jgi:hypothetical protein